MLRLQYVEERGICICRLELSSHPLRLGYICTLRAGKCDGQFEATDDAGMFSNRVLVVEHHRCESGSGGVRDGTTANWLVVKARAIR